MDSDTLYLWTIYEHPIDYPEHYVLRRFLIKAGTWVPDPQPIKVASSVAECRAALPMGVTNLGREEADESQIVETWI